jgi:hypothetical protein
MRKLKESRNLVKPKANKEKEQNEQDSDVSLNPITAHLSVTTMHACFTGVGSKRAWPYKELE